MSTMVPFREKSELVLLALTFKLASRDPNMQQFVHCGSQVDIAESISHLGSLGIKPCAGEDFVMCLWTEVQYP